MADTLPSSATPPPRAGKRRVLVVALLLGTGLLLLPEDLARAVQSGNSDAAAFVDDPWWTEEVMPADNAAQAYDNLCDVAAQQDPGIFHGGKTAWVNNETALNATCGNRSSMIAAFEDTVRGKAYIVASKMKKSFGLTNQLLVYAGLVSFLHLPARRRLWLVPPEARVALPQLVDLRRSTFRGRNWIVDDPCEAHVARLRKRRRLRKRWERLIVRNLMEVPWMANVTLKTYISTIANDNATRTLEIWDMYLRWPFQLVPMSHGIVDFFCGIVFGSPIRAAVELAWEGACLLGPENCGEFAYVAVHLRLELQDSSAMGRARISDNQVSDFFRNAVMPTAVKSNVKVVLVCSGPLDSKLLPRLANESLRSHGIRVVSKSDLWDAVRAARPERVADVMQGLEEQRHAYRSRGKTLAPTNTQHAAVDALVLQGARQAILTAYSSLTSLVTTRRCCDSCSDARDDAPAVGALLYDVFRNGTLTRPKPFRCGTVMRPYVEASDMFFPRPELGDEDLFPLQYNLSSALFTP